MKSLKKLGGGGGSSGIDPATVVTPLPDEELIAKRTKKARVKAAAERKGRASTIFSEDYNDTQLG